jgi:hypothetical protein
MRRQLSRISEIFFQRPGLRLKKRRRIGKLLTARYGTNAGLRERALESGTHGRAELRRTSVVTVMPLLSMLPLSVKR